MVKLGKVPQLCCVPSLQQIAGRQSALSLAPSDPITVLFQGDVCMQDLSARWSGCRRALLCGDEDLTVLRSGGSLQFAIQVFVYAQGALAGGGLAVWADPDNVNIPRGGQVCGPGQVGDLDVQLGISVGAASMDADNAACGGNTAVGGHVVGFAARKWPEGEKQNQDGKDIHMPKYFTRWGQAACNPVGCVSATITGERPCTDQYASK